MISFVDNNLTEGYIARHIPMGSGSQGREAAIIDIAQDFLLSFLSDADLMGRVCLKGGTAIRKFYAGKEGRFSLDLDFSIDDKHSNPDDIAFDFISKIDGLQLGPFSYSISERRGKWYIEISSGFDTGNTFRTKLDFASYPWLDTKQMHIVPMQIHKQYGFEVPLINTVSLEENMAEKIARLNRTSTARDIYDLNWIMDNKSVSGTLDIKLLRRLVVLKIWVDSYGMHCGNVYWHPAHEPSVFDPERWLYSRNPKDVDSEDIGALAVPCPTAEEMIERLKTNFTFLLDLDETEQIIAISNQRDRGVVIKALAQLPGGRLQDRLY